MEAVVGLLVMLLRVSSGVETYCDGRQNGAQCYGALGGTVFLQLMENTSEIYQFQWTKNNTVIIYWRNNYFLENKIQDRSLFTPSDGTLRINNLNRNDGGEYKLEIYDSNGLKLSPRYLQFSIQAPVSSVLLVSECLSQGEMRVSCSSDGGDSPQYSWTLDGHTLTDAELLSGNKETNNITLKQHVSGNLVCSVRNHVSHVSKEETISDCGFIFINCMSSNGTHISQWVFAANNTLCVGPTTTVTTVCKETETIVSGKPITNVSNNIKNQTASDGSWIFSKIFCLCPTDQSLLIFGLRAAVAFLILTGIFVYFSLKKNKTKKVEDSVLMVEMRSSTSQL
ncbi:hypothetical protein Q5P01_009029 [Channa striata]|uniref:Ig-like domain-containing protein n=1 Tax=Channa striata TaxID=64152 RepID=A0AA88N349_CHASR|nr:hypothetical protein Q5P01_009029 [Channa striata]